MTAPSKVAERQRTAAAREYRLTRILLRDRLPPDRLDVAAIDAAEAAHDRAGTALDNWSQDQAEFLANEGMKP